MKNDNSKLYLKTPIGLAVIEGNADAVTKITICEDGDRPLRLSPNTPKAIQDCADQLKRYFQGKQKEFNLNLSPEGTTFQKKVWNALGEIPYGETWSYADLAKSIGDKMAVRAVAFANGKNPLWIVIPCHRVIGSNGELRGYAGGIWRKRWLLKHENALKQFTLF